MRTMPEYTACSLLGAVWLCFASCAGAPPDAVPGRFVLHSPPTTQSLRALSVVDGDTVWVGGSGGALFRTLDGGVSWANVAPPGTGHCDFRDVEAFDRDTAVVMVAGQPAHVHRTIDGGATWQLVHVDARPTAFFDAMAFDGAFGVLFGDPIDGAFVILRSDDTGATWVPVPAAHLPAPLPGEAAFAASGTCVVARAGRRIAWVTGGGSTRFLTAAVDRRELTAVELPLASGAASRGAFSLAFSGQRAVVVGGDYQEAENPLGTAAITDDAGETWRAVASGGGYRSAVLWCGPNTVLAVGPNGAGWSADGGRTFVAVDARFHTLAKGRDGSVWAAGADGRVARWLDP